MWKFIRNLLKLCRKKKEETKTENNTETIIDGDMEIKLDREGGTMIISCPRNLSPEEIIEVMHKYLDGGRDE